MENAAGFVGGQRLGQERLDERPRGGRLRQVGQPLRPPLVELNLLRMTASARLTAAGVDLDTAPGVLGAARTAVEDGALGYALLIAERTPE